MNKQDKIVKRRNVAPDDDGADALGNEVNPWNPERESLEDWRSRRRAAWRRERDRVLITGDY